MLNIDRRNTRRKGRIRFFLLNRRRHIFLCLLLFSASCRNGNAYLAKNNNGKAEILHSERKMKKNGIEVVHVPKGCFKMGCTKRQCKEDEKPAHRVCLDSFYLAKYEVSVAQYDLCVKAGVCGLANKYAQKHKYKKDCNYGRPGYEKHPINCVKWKDSQAFCKWKKGRLPTEAEWERAAKGEDNREYPWGNEKPSCKLAVYKKGTQKGCGKGSTWPVGAKKGGKSYYGAFNMGGNVGEWTQDCYLDIYFSHRIGKTTYNPNHLCKCRYSPKRGCQPRAFVTRGGCWLGGPEYLRTTERDELFETVRLATGLGFRCVWEK